MNYMVIIPAKNEGLGISETLNSVANQTLVPAICLVIDDGSTDNTADIIKEFERNFTFIRYIKKTTGINKQYRLGGHVVDVFNSGLSEALKMGISSDYIIKMDADVSFEADFIENIFKIIENHDDFGIVSGTPFYLEDGLKKYEYSPDWHTHGQFKIYNNKCLKEIGGLKRSLGWDTADNIVAISRGWKTVAFRDINYKMARKVGGKSSLLRGRIIHGIGCYLLGYSFLYLIMKMLHDVFKKPYFVGTCCFFYGYCKARIIKYNVILSRKEIHLLKKLLWQSFSRRLKNRDFILLQNLNVLRKRNIYA